MKSFTVVLGVWVFLVFFYFEKLLRTFLTFVTVRYNHNAKQKNKQINACKVKMNCPIHAQGPCKTVPFTNSWTRKSPLDYPLLKLTFLKREAL